jgi:putative nucleotidyltransferase with HDIG domain
MQKGLSVPVSLSRLVPQPLIAAGTALVAGVIILGAWGLTPAPQSAHEMELDTLVSLGLGGALLLAYHYPIHIRLGSKVYMTTVLYFLLATLLPLPLAVTVALLGAVGGELSVRSITKNYPSDIVTIAGAATMMTAAAGAVAHLPLPIHEAAALYLLAGLALLLVEHLTAPAIFYPITGEAPLRLMLAIAREGGPVELAQVVIGLLGAFAATQEMWSLVLLTLPTALVYISFKRAKEMDDGTRHTLESIADTVDLRDPYTGGHSRRVTEYTAGILEALGKSGPEVDLIVWAARVHDIGKIAVPDGILNKPARLTDEERAVMETHPEKGAEFLARYPQFARGVEIVRHHHEAWDGSGYPHRLRDTHIPFGSRIIAVADSYDAMTSDRPYRKGMEPSRAAAILREGRGKQWDGEIVDAFLHSIAGELSASSAPVLRLMVPEDAAAVS